MATTVGDFMVSRLQKWGIKRIYGYPGDGINGIMGALNRADGAIEFVQARHEEMAAFMACAPAKFTGEVGVCLATSGPDLQKNPPPSDAPDLLSYRKRGESSTIQPSSNF